MSLKNDSFLFLLVINFFLVRSSDSEKADDSLEKVTKAVFIYS